MTTDPFAPDYFAARQRFRDAARRLGWHHEAHPIAATGPKGEPLTVDVALSPPAAGPTVVLTSGVHGVEGFFGSAVQAAMLEEWEQKPPAGRVVLVHAVSPHGFAHLRRFDENNVDPNRNFLLAGEPFAGSPPLYGTIDRVLNPTWPPWRFEPFALRAGLTMARHGRSALKQAIVEGQYDYPRGLFFGGHAPSESQRLLGQHWRRWLGDAEQVWHLDFHTGLGPRGTHKLLIDPPLSPKLIAEAEARFGADALEVAAITGVAYESRGGFGGWCVERTPGAEYAYFCAEFGTYHDFKVFSGLRTENQAHHALGPDHPRSVRARQELKELFGPADLGWRVKVVADGCGLVRRAFGAFAPAVEDRRIGEP